MNEELENRFNELCEEYNTDVFLEPYLYYGKYIFVVSMEQEQDEDFYQPLEDSDLIIKDSDVMEGFLVRASANGNLDCTDWEPIEDIKDLENWFDMYYELKEDMED